jgi:hypothetical protein
MKVLDVPSTGKRGVVVGQGGRYGQVSRTLAIPTNPRTTAQLAVRQALSNQSKRWRTLTQAQIAAWNTAAADQQTTPEDGQSGRMTGLQLFVQVNTVAILTGQPTVSNPPPAVAPVGLPAITLTLTNTAGVVSIKLATAGAMPAIALVKACKPQSAGISICNNWRKLGLCPPVTSGAADITALFTAKFGAPIAGKKLFIQVVEVAGYTVEIPSQYEGVVPGAT